MHHADGAGSSYSFSFVLDKQSMLEDNVKIFDGDDMEIMDLPIAHAEVVVGQSTDEYDSHDSADDMATHEYKQHNDVSVVLLCQVTTFVY